MATTATAAITGLGLFFLLVLSVTGGSVSPTLISTIPLLQNNATTAHTTTTNATTASKPPVTHSYTTKQNHTTTQSSTTALPEPGVGSYNVSQKTGVCLRADLALRLYVSYKDNASNIKHDWRCIVQKTFALYIANRSTSHVQTIALPLLTRGQNTLFGTSLVGQFNVDPNDTRASGNCGDTESLLNLTFSHGFVLAVFTKGRHGKVQFGHISLGGGENQSGWPLGNITCYERFHERPDLEMFDHCHEFVAYRRKLGDKNEFSVTEVNATLKYQFPDTQVEEYSVSSGPVSYTLAPANTSYRCIANLRLPVTANFSLDLSHVQLQPFNLENGTFSPVTDCTQDKTTPIPTTTHSSTTTHSPSTSSPPFLPGKYNVSEEGHACLLVDVALEVQVEDSQNKTHIFVVHPSRTSASGHCQSITSLLNLTFAEGFIAFTFATSNKRFHLDQISIDLKLHIPDAPNDTFVGSKGNLTLFPANLGSSYMCKAKQNESVGDKILLMVSDLRLQPFKVQNNAFSTAEECTRDVGGVLIPIIVGSVLAGLIVIVLVAYLIGRRKNHTGYQSI